MQYMYVVLTALNNKFNTSILFMYKHAAMSILLYTFEWGETLVHRGNPTPQYINLHSSGSSHLETSFLLLVCLLQLCLFNTLAIGIVVTFSSDVAFVTCFVRLSSILQYVYFQSSYNTAYSFLAISLVNQAVYVRLYTHYIHTKQHHLLSKCM